MHFSKITSIQALHCVLCISGDYKAAQRKQRCALPEGI